jgi:glycine dehydrogenase subunit 2
MTSMDTMQLESIAQPEQELPLVFEIGAPGATAVAMPASDVPAADRHTAVPAGMLAAHSPALPEVGELDLVRHFTRLSHRVFSIDENFYPLGSCTMKYNPRLNERVAAMPGFSQLHPYQDESDVQGLLEMLYRLKKYLAEIAGMAEVSLQPAAGAHGEMAGLMIINAYHRAQGQDRRVVLAPDSAHGTNPASCTICALDSAKVRSRPDGRVDLDDLRTKVDDDTAALMITNPNTCGVFDDQIADIAEILHKRGAMLYYDGANMNAALGIIRPGDVGVDVMHYNTHKTFSTPHGGGGPGAGPVGVIEKLRPYLPRPTLTRRDDGTYFWDYDRPHSVGRVRSFYGQIGVLVRAYTYIRSVGGPGLRRIADRAVLNANYIAARLKARYPMPFPAPYAHEFITVPRLAESDVTERDFAKRLIDYGIHPPTMSWPIHHCLMIEPSETESLATLDRFCEVMLKMADEARNQPELLRTAPHVTPVGRLDEVAANRKPNVRWRAQ